MDILISIINSLVFFYNIFFHTEILCARVKLFTKVGTLTTSVELKFYNVFILILSKKEEEVLVLINFCKCLNETKNTVD